MTAPGIMRGYDCGGRYVALPDVFGERGHDEHMEWALSPSGRKDGVLSFVLFFNLIPFRRSCREPIFFPKPCQPLPFLHEHVRGLCGKFLDILFSTDSSRTRLVRDRELLCLDIESMQPSSGIISPRRGRQRRPLSRGLRR